MMQHKFSFIFLLNINVAFGLNIFGPQPKIITEDGHLILRAAENRNISLQTRGKGKIQWNGVDLSNAAEMVKSATLVLNKYTTNFEDSFNRIDRFETLIKGHRGILERLTYLEQEARNLTSSSTSSLSSYKIAKLSRQLITAQDNLKSITSLLVKNECQSNPCQNGGTCQDLFNDFLCHCPEGWEGKLCDKDVNECARFLGTDLGCQNGATCYNVRGSYQCACAHGWYGLHCTRRSKDCNAGSSSDLCGHGTCVSQNNDLGYTCICDQGWTTGDASPVCSKDMDECKINRPPCSVNPLVTCVNTPGSFRCGSCPKGYTGNGFYCTDINECEMFNGGCSVFPKVKCINLLGSVKCGSCPPSYVGDGITCTFKGICYSNNGGCHPLAKCFPVLKYGNIGGVGCTCPAGYSGNGKGPYGCVQTNITPCSPNPCKNGVCIANSTSSTGFTCKCDATFFGRTCSLSLNACSNNPCKNGGRCSNVGLSYRCTCTSSWTGNNCERERSACGAVLNGESGTLRYPPSNFAVRPGYHSCAWIIETNDKKILNITFGKFEIQGSRNCDKDWLQIHDGKSTASHMLARFCGGDLPKNGSLVTTHNAVYIWYRTDNMGIDSGFELNWNSTNHTCNYNISVNNHGTIQSPGSPGLYPNNRDCFWYLTAPTGKRFLFHFFSFDVGTSTNCTGDYLEFYSTRNRKKSSYSKYCNSSVLPSPLHSPGSQTTVYFHSDDKGQHSGFQISYSLVEGIPGCGGLFTADRGELRSPTMDGKYLSDLSCVYKIRLNRGLRMKIEFLSFDLENERNCKFDFVEIYQGPSTESPLIARYCGSDLPPPFTSLSNEITVYFKSDWATAFAGFVMRYETVCGGVFTEPTGILQSDGYPDHYTAGINCIYEIVQPIGNIIKLTFLDFQLETGNVDNEGDCYDYVEVRDGENENSTLIGKYCDVTPPLIVSSLNYLWLKFASDESIGGRGFRANYTATNLGCGGFLKDKVGTVSSPGSDGMYESNRKCYWVIKAPPGNLIRINWVTFQIQLRYICDFDYVMVYDNNTISGRGGLVGKYCGNRLPPSMISTSNIVTVIFVSDNDNNQGGFTFSYNFIEEAKLCGGNFHSPGGVIRSPGYPSKYSTNADCTWTITVPPGHQILLNITKFDIKDFVECKYSALEIRNGKTASSPLIGRFCGTNIPKTIPSQTNQMYLYFKSDIHGYGAGFEIIWESAATGCGGILNAPLGSVVSPMYPEPYNKYADCAWKISVGAGSLIQIIFTDIDLEVQSLCLLDYVELYDGSGMGSKLIGRYCTPTHPPFIRSTSNHVYVHFKSDISFQGRGFQLQYSTICNNNLTGFFGVIESPNFPNEYQKPQDCTWNIEVEKNNKINISFSHFDLRIPFDFRNKNCSKTYLQIEYRTETEEGNIYYESYGKYCGGNIPSPFTLKHDYARIHFVSDTSMIGTGFRLEWVLEGCGGKMYRAGTISSPNYPKGYPLSTGCKWELETDFGNVIEITFAEVDIEPLNHCEYDSLMVYNGPDNTSPLMAKLCHQTKPITLTSIGNRMSVYFNSDSSYVRKGFTANFTSLKAKCGGKMIAPEGSIFSPNYPKNYDRNETCVWLIEVDKNHLVSLEFEVVELLTQPRLCKGNYIAVYDGLPTPYSTSKTYPLLSTICGTNKPNKTITSTYNYLIVEFKSYSFFTTKGFKANFFKACGARLNATDSGNIVLRPESVNSNRVENCTWTIVAPQSNRVSLDINHLNTNTYCTDTEHPLVIYDGESSSGTPIGEYCGIKTPPTLISSGNALHVVASSEVQMTATYYVYGSDCGGTISSFEGNFATPGYPQSYPFETDCEWTVYVAPGNHISLSFKEFDIPSSDKCRTDYLEIRQNNSSGKLLGTYCGQEEPTNITTTGSLWFYFKSSTKRESGSFMNPKGFIAEYVLDRSNTLNGPSGQIANPLYPEPFWAMGEYSWRVSVKFGQRISFVVKEIMIDSYNLDDCEGLKFYDGIDNTAPLLRSICGFSYTEPIKTTSNEAFIQAIFSNEKSGNKFLIEWKEISEYLSDKSENKTTIQGCGSPSTININDLRNYTLKSPGYPNGYEKNLNCEWTFSTSPMNRLSIVFNTIDLTPFYNGLIQLCYLTRVEISTGKHGSEDWKLIKSVCHGNQTDSPIAAGNLMKVKFISDYNQNGTGFEAEVREACGGTIEQSEGYIIFDDKHARGRKCEWNITVSAGRTIKINFPIFNIEPGRASGCNNYLMLKNGFASDSSIVGDGKYCGNSRPNLNTTGNQLYVKYLGTPNIRGFTLHFKETRYDCGGPILLTTIENSTTINSPNYPNIPSPHIDCVWVIRSPPGTTIQLDFLERFDLTRTDDCSTEAVEIRDGATEFSPPIGRFCKNMPSTQFSRDNIMYLKFFTNVDDPRNGFKAKASLAQCGGTLRDKIGKLQWSSTNRGTVQNQNCTWRIIIPQDNYLTLKFDNIRLRAIYIKCNASAEKLKIYAVDSVQKTERLVKVICSSYDTNDIVLNTNEAVVRYERSSHPTSWSYSSRTDFSISYNSTRQNCTFNLFNSFGYIKSPGYPLHSYSVKNCRWNIRAPEGRRITLRFLDLDLDESAEFQNQGIAIFDSIDMRMLIASLPNGTHTGTYVTRANRTNTYKSSANTMLMFFWSVDAYGRGFFARYTTEEETVCQGSFNQTSGIINLPKENSFVCTWKRTQARTTLKLSITMHLNITTYSRFRCRRNEAGLLIFSEDKMRILQFEMCQNTTTPEIIRTSYPKTELQIWGKRSTFDFTVTYDTYDCGDILKNEMGWLSSPNFPQKPKTTMECSWIIKLPDTQQINVTFSNFDLGDNCDKSFIDVYNGATQRAPRIGRFCKNNKPGVIVSQRNNLLIDYHFEQNSGGVGFNLTYQPVIRGCGGVFHENHRIIQSPGYPDKDYPKNAECTWEVRAKGGYHIGLSFLGRFHLDESDGCNEDFLKVYDWKDGDWVLLKTLCGRDIPKPINSTENQMKIVFRSNDKIEARGFKAKWDFNCGGTFEATKTDQYIMSPGYPLEYDNHLHCEYKIRPSSSSEQLVNVYFIDFQLEYGMPLCEADNVTLKSAYAYDYSRRKVFCGDEKPPFSQFRDGVNIIFKTDFSLTRSGFKLAFRVDGCMENITAPTRIISPVVKNRDTYSSFMKCFWNITAPESKIIVLRFEKLETPYSQSCSYDGIQIYDGSIEESDKRLAALCGNITSSLPVITTPNNTASITSVVRSKSHNFIIDVFFTAGPKDGCGGFINLTSLTEIQRDFSSKRDIMDCSWYFIASEDYQIEIEITQITLSTCRKSCGCGFLELRDGGSSLSTLIEKLCETITQTKRYVTSTRYGFFRYNGIGSNGASFSVKFKPILSKCGKFMLNITDQVQTLTSPNYPNKYPENLRCSWLLKPKESYKTFILKFIDFELSEEESNKDCRHDYLEIENGNQYETYGMGLGANTVFAGRGSTFTDYSDTAIGVHSFCGRNEKPFNYYASSALTIIMQSKYGPNRGKGFKMEYQLIGCNHNYTGSSGKIKTSIDGTQDCLIGITVATNRTISLFISQFYSSFTSGCTKDSLTIIDGDLSTGKQLGKWCGYEALDPIFSTTNVVWLKIHSNKDSSEVSLHSSYTSSDKGRGCGGEFYDVSGKFTSPFYPNDYRNDTLCTWQVRGPINSRLQLHLVVFDISATCELNYLNVTTFENGLKNVHNFCKDDDPAKLESDEKLIVTYKSSVRNGGRGWVAEFSTVSRVTGYTDFAVPHIELDDAPIA